MLIDPAVLQMLKTLRMPGKPDPVAEILQVFEADGRQVLGRLQLAVRSDDGEATHRTAHRLKGAAANLGAIELQGRLLHIEQSTAEGLLPDDIPALVEQLPALFQQTLLELHREAG